MQLRRIPLPIGSKDRHFNFEKIIDENVHSSIAFLIPERDGSEFASGSGVDWATGTGN